jgi:hypothetical protein
VRDSDVTVRGLKRTAEPRHFTLERHHSHAPEQADIPLSDAGFGLTERRGRDLNPRRTQKAETVFEICSACLVDYFDDRSDELEPSTSSYDVLRSQPVASFGLFSRFRPRRRCAADCDRFPLAGSIKAQSANARALWPGVFLRA